MLSANVAVVDAWQPQYGVTVLKESTSDNDFLDS
jgi:hypothetical protein